LCTCYSRDIRLAKPHSRPRASLLAPGVLSSCSFLLVLVICEGFFLFCSFSPFSCFLACIPPGFLGMPHFCRAGGSAPANLVLRNTCPNAEMSDLQEAADCKGFYSTWPRNRPPRTAPVAQVSQYIMGLVEQIPARAGLLFGNT